MGMKGLGKGEGVLVGAGKDKEFVGSLRRVGFLGKELEGLFKVEMVGFKVREEEGSFGEVRGGLDSDGGCVGWGL
ncbi:hypothetical protein SCA6_010265 [Theobroma cacao]